MAQDVHRPVAALRYSLTVSDALAFERLPGEWTAWQKVAFMLPLIGIAAVAGFFEEALGTWWSAAICGLLLLWAICTIVVRNWRRQWLASARSAREGAMQVEDRGNHLVIRSQAGTIRLGDEMIGKVIVDDRGMFILHHGGALIIPVRAFASAQEMRAFGDKIDARSMQAAQ